MAITFAQEKWRGLLEYYYEQSCNSYHSQDKINLLFSLIQFWFLSTSFSIEPTDWALRILFSPVIFLFQVIWSNHSNWHLICQMTHKKPVLCCFQIGIVLISIGNIMPFFSENLHLCSQSFIGSVGFWILAFLDPVQFSTIPQNSVVVPPCDLSIQMCTIISGDHQSTQCSPASSPA